MSVAIVWHSSGKRVHVRLQGPGRDTRTAYSASTVAYVEKESAVQTPDHPHEWHALVPLLSRVCWTTIQFARGSVMLAVALLLGAALLLLSLLVLDLGLAALGTSAAVLQAGLSHDVAPVIWFQ